MNLLRRTRHLFVMLASISAMLLGACHDDGLINPPETSDSCCARIVVNVSVSRTTAPLSGVAVALRKGTTVVATKETDSNGVVTFSEVCNAEYNLRLTKTGYSVAEQGGIVIDSCGVRNIGMGMLSTGEIDPRDSCCDATLRVIPTDTHGTPLPGTQVKLTGPNGFVRTIESGNDGALFSDLCRGVYGLRIAREGYKVSESSVEVGCNTEATERRLLTRNEQTDSCCDARLVVNTTAGNEFLNGATVKLWKGGALIRTLVSNGRAVVFEDLCEGTYGISASKEGYKPVEANIFVRCNSISEKSLNLVRNETDECCNNVMSMHVLDANTRRALANATVKLLRGGVVKATMRTGADGAVSFTGLCKGEYVAVAERDGYRAAEMRVNVICGSLSEETIVLTPNAPTTDTCCTAVYRLKVFGSERDTPIPLSGARVVIKRNDAVIADGTTNREGVVEFERLCGKTHYVVVIEHEQYLRKAMEVTIEQCRLYEGEARMTRR